MEEETAKSFLISSRDEEVNAPDVGKRFDWRRRSVIFDSMEVSGGKVE